MKNNLIKFFLYIFLSLTLTLQSSSNEVINLNVTLIEISENGNVLKGYDGGEAFTNDGISITAENFELTILNQDAPPAPFCEGNIPM